MAVQSGTNGVLHTADASPRQQRTPPPQWRVWVVSGASRGIGAEYVRQVRTAA